MNVPETCQAARTGEGYWTCDVLGGCVTCRRLARGADDKMQLDAWDIDVNRQREFDARRPYVAVEDSYVRGAVWSYFVQDNRGNVISEWPTMREAQASADALNGKPADPRA